MICASSLGCFFFFFVEGDAAEEWGVGVNSLLRQYFTLYRTVFWTHQTRLCGSCLDAIAVLTYLFDH